MKLESRFFSAMVLIFFSVIIKTQGKYYSDTQLAEPRKPRKTDLQFYLHGVLSGSDPSAVLVAQPNRTIGAKSATLFGTLYAIDDTNTERPEPYSKVVGHAHGLYLSSSEDKLSLVMYVDFGFTTGKFNGSSISVFSRNPVSEGDIELAVVGGRKEFRMAKGFAQLKTHSFNTTAGDAVIKYKVTVYH
ncbi:hypothetical protein Ancab_017390 [Ancistrocladus abbreviatus]